MTDGTFNGNCACDICEHGVLGLHTGYYLLHEKLVAQCEVYLDKGYISEGQYRDLDEYIYQPYRNLGGNGTGEEYMKRVQALIFERKEKK